MSRSVDLFISSSEPLEVVAARIAEVAKVESIQGPGGSVLIREGDVTVSLAPHGYVDDGDLFLSRYQWVLTGRVPSTARPQDTPAAALLRKVGTCLQQATSWPVLMVLDLQYREVVAAGDAAAQVGEAAP